MNRLTSAAAVLAAVSVLGLAGCKSSADGAAPAPAPTQTQPTPPADAATPPAEESSKEPGEAMAFVVSALRHPGSEVVKGLSTPEMKADLDALDAWHAKNC